ncbi:helix-turn-helix transcriptional regulator [bacterium]|nr:helix-turn-helix transcriptional regulator [bacterium]
MAHSEYLAGVLRILILSELSRGEGYGYGIAKGIARASGDELTVRPESLYPVLHRMEEEQLVKARWETAETGRPRKVYTLTPKGKRRWDKAQREFKALSSATLRVIESGPAESAS